MSVIWDFIRDNWISVTGGLIGVIVFTVIPALRGIAIVAIKAAAKRLFNAFISMFTADLLIAGALKIGEKLVKSTKTPNDDKWFDEYKKKLEVGK